MNEGNIQHFIVGQGEGDRLDKFLAAKVKEQSRSRLKQLIMDSAVSVNGKTVTNPAAKVQINDRVMLLIPETEQIGLIARDIPFEILFEDDDLLVINKPAGLTVHPAPGHMDDTLVNALMHHCGSSLSGIGGELRPGIVHRLDKDTSGLMIVAKNDMAHRQLATQLETRTLSRIYIAFVWGVLSPLKGTITGNIGRSPRNRKKMAVLAKGGKLAVTHYQTTIRFIPKKEVKPLVSVVSCKLETGRTHQIRVHLSNKGNALLGDPLYGSTTRHRLRGTAIGEMEEKLLQFHRQALHASAIAFTHPRNEAPMKFTCNLPGDMNELYLYLYEYMNEIHE